MIYFVCWKLLLVHVLLMAAALTLGVDLSSAELLYPNASDDLRGFIWFIILLWRVCPRVRMLYWIALTCLCLCLSQHTHKHTFPFVSCCPLSPLASISIQRDHNRLTINSFPFPLQPATVTRLSLPEFLHVPVKHKMNLWWLWAAGGKWKTKCYIAKCQQRHAQIWQSRSFKRRRQCPNCHRISRTRNLNISGSAVWQNEWAACRDVSERNVSFFHKHFSITTHKSKFRRSLWVSVPFTNTQVIQPQTARSYIWTFL